MNELAITDHIRNVIKNERKKNKIIGTKLGKEIGKSESYISHIENGNIKTIDYEDLKAIFQYILKIDQQQLSDYLEELISNSVKSDFKKTPLHSSLKEARPNSLEYNIYDSAIMEEDFKKILDKIIEGFIVVYQGQQDYTYSSLHSFLKNLRDFDFGFMLGIIRLPFYEMKKLDLSSKQLLFNEISDFVEEYLKEYKKIESQNSDSDTH
ncbi:helix-turn-helix transcriptional regulator [Desulfitobacterium sp. PCE1]|uniref:helix-turn-helix domain-containing protein n=1 Tax=Desulfitobacterium sp. PCE1 TaxID=146907 RepID=UPI0003606B94|nr:helix-turn-helix transcriptional regulator [Desulfitobacterium sp. PCE1]